MAGQADLVETIIDAEKILSDFVEFKTDRLKTIADRLETTPANISSATEPLSVIHQRAKSYHRTG